MAGTGHISVVPDLEAIKCGCGKMGCVETVSSATGIIRMAKDAVERGDHTSWHLSTRLSRKKYLMLQEQAMKWHSRIVNRAAFYGQFMATVAAVINPEMFIIGGGVSKAGNFF